MNVFKVEWVKDLGGEETTYVAAETIGEAIAQVEEKETLLTYVRRAEDLGPILIAKRSM